MCDITDLGKLLSQKKEEEEKNRAEAAKLGFIQGGIDDNPFFLVNKKTGKKAEFVGDSEIEEIEEAEIFNFPGKD